MSGSCGHRAGAAGSVTVASYCIHAADRNRSESLPVLCCMGKRDTVCRYYLHSSSVLRVPPGAFAHIADGGSCVFGQSGVLPCGTAAEKVEALCVCAAAESGDPVVLYGYCLQFVPSATAGKEPASDIHGHSPVDDSASGCGRGGVFVERAAAKRDCLKMKNSLTN